jgi:hypothetical protein
MSDTSRYLRKALAVFAGAILGGIATVALLMLWGVTNWLAWIPIPFGGVIGLVYGDRGIAAIARGVGWF